jgi:hypothetical protein
VSLRKNPGVWILGPPMDEDRNRGMGIVVEYAGRKGKPQRHPPGKSDWNYLLFGESKSAVALDEVIPISGIFKDTVLVRGLSRVDIDFVADNPVLTLFHCHQNLHMDFGFMRLFEYV